MRALEISIGQRFGRLTVVHIERRKGGTRMAIVKCDCGRTVTVRPSAMVNGPTKSCGCYNREIHTKHGLSRTKIYQRWRSMLNRCRYPSDPNYEYYGGRGIQVCERWNEFENFLADMGMPPNERTELDRVDGDGNYEPGNVRWASKLEQIHNRRRTSAKRTDSGNLFKGVIPKGNRWQARISISGKSHYLGSHPTEEAAARAYDSVARLYKGYRLNFPEGT